MESVAAPVGETERLEISAVADAPATERLRATTAPKRSATGRPGMRRFSWRTIAATAAIVFILALMFITAIELISGKPLSSIYGGSDTGTTLSNLDRNPATPTTTTSIDDVNDVCHDDDEHHRADLDDDHDDLARTLDDHDDGRERHDDDIDVTPVNARVTSP